MADETFVVISIGNTLGSFLYSSSWHKEPAFLLGRIVLFGYSYAKVLSNDTYEMGFRGCIPTVVSNAKKTPKYSPEYPGFKIVGEVSQLIIQYGPSRKDIRALPLAFVSVGEVGGTEYFLGCRYATDEFIKKFGIDMDEVEMTHKEVFEFSITQIP